MTLEKKAARARIRRKTHAAVISRQRQLRYAANPEKYRQLTRENYYRRKNLPASTRPRPQLCECCGNPPGKKGLALDHCHETGKFRGWLCTNCNIGIGNLGDTVDGLLRALDYLSRNS